MRSAPLYDDVADAPPGGEAWWVTADDGTELRIAAWGPAGDRTVRGTVLLFPGRTEYVEKYGRTARHYTGEGFAVITLDWRGQGLTARAMADRRLGHVESFADYQRDVAALTNLAAWLELPEPWFLVAHSMGGCIGKRALHDGLPVRAAAFSAPMWGIHMEAWERPLAWTTAFLAPLVGLGGKLTPRTALDHLLLAGPFEDNDLTTDRETWDFMKAQIDRYPDLVLGGPTISWARAALVETVRLSRLPAPELPVVTFLGTRERVVSPRAIRREMARWDAGTLVIADGAEHEILMERPEVRERFLAASTDLFLAQG